MDGRNAAAFRMRVLRSIALVVGVLLAYSLPPACAKSGCAFIGCEQGWQCDTEYNLEGDCVQVFSDDDIDGDTSEEIWDTENIDGIFAAQDMRVKDESQVSRNRLHFSDGGDGAVDAADGVDNDLERQSWGGDRGGQALADHIQSHAAVESTSGSETPCQQARDEATAKCNGMLGCFVMQCQADGSYSPEQCHGSTGYCWCVYTDGQRIPDTSTPPGQVRGVCTRRDNPHRVGAAQTSATPATESTVSLPAVAQLEHGTSFEFENNNLEADKDGLQEDNAVDDNNNADGAKAAVEQAADDTEQSQNALSGASAAASTAESSSTKSNQGAGDATGPPIHVDDLKTASVFLWVIVACCVAFVVSIPVLFVCVYQAVKRQNGPSKPYVFYNHNVPVKATAQEKELMVRTARNYRHGVVPSSQEKSVILPPQTWSTTVPGHMDIFTGHKVLQYLEEHISNPEKLAEEWEGVSGYKAEGESVSDAQSDFNAGKNRYSDILPYDDHRVKLDVSSNASRSDYVNASTIHDRDPRRAAYIATQGPLDATVADFWQMVWESGCTIIVMLTKLHDGGMTQCHRYWPQQGQQIYHMFEVQLVSEHCMSEEYSVRSLYVINLKTKLTRTVTQYQFLSWPHLAVPSMAQPLLDFRRKVKKSYADASAPIVVHDNAGVGRVGCYILLDMLLNRLADSAVKEIDMAASVEHLRDQRMSMVQTEEQFRFAYTALVVEVRSILDAMPK